MSNCTEVRKLKFDVKSLLKGQSRIYRPEYNFRKSHVAKLIKQLTNFIYQRVSIETWIGVSKLNKLLTEFSRNVKHRVLFYLCYANELRFHQGQIFAITIKYVPKMGIRTVTRFFYVSNAFFNSDSVLLNFFMN